MPACGVVLRLKGCRWWWYAVAAGLLVAQWAAPLALSRGPFLGVAWIWPVLIWSAMGAREARHDTHELILSAANNLSRQLPACWLAGVAVAAVTGGGAAVRLLLAGQFSGMLAWSAGALFVPALALALGVWSGTSKVFEALYTTLWYIGPLNGVPGFDFTGGASGALTVRYALVHLALSGALLLGALLGRRRQLRTA